MSLCPGHPQLRGRIVESLAEVLRLEHHTTVGALLSIDGTTVTRRGPDLSAWKWSDALELGLTYPGIGKAMAGFFEGEAGEARPALAVPDSCSALRHLLGLATALTTAIQDQRVSQAEAASTLPLIGELQAQLEQLALNYRAIAQAGQ